MAATSNTNGLDFNAPVAPELLAPDNSSSSFEEPSYILAFGEYMFCYARGFEYDRCNECNNIFHPIQDSPPDDDSPGIPEEHEEHDPALNHVCRAMMASLNTDCVSDNDARDYLARLGPHRVTSAQEIFFGPDRPTSAPDDTSQVVMEEESEQVRAGSVALVLNAFDNHSLDYLTNYNSTTSEYMPTYFDYFDTVSDAPSSDPLSSFIDRSPCSLLLSDDEFSYQLDVDNSLDDDDDNDDIFYDAVPDEGDLDVFFDAFDTFDDDTTVDANVPFCWVYYTLMSQWMFPLLHQPFNMILFSVRFRWAYYTLMLQWMFTLFHRPFNMILFSLTWVSQVVQFLFSAQPFLLASALVWDTLI